MGILRTILPVLGHRVVIVAGTGRELVEKCRDQHPDLVITDISMPDMDGIDAAGQIYRDGPIPVILVSAHTDVDLIRRAEANHILSYLVKPIKQADLEPSIAIGMRRFKQFQELRPEAVDLKQALEDRKLIERAKGLLMKKASLDEVVDGRRPGGLAPGRHSVSPSVRRGGDGKGEGDPPLGARGTDRDLAAGDTGQIILCRIHPPGSFSGGQ